jgi:hypothetical protein
MRQSSTAQHNRSGFAAGPRQPAGRPQRHEASAGGAPDQVNSQLVDAGMLRRSADSRWHRRLRVIGQRPALSHPAGRLSGHRAGLRLPGAPGRSSRHDQQHPRPREMTGADLPVVGSRGTADSLGRCSGPWPMSAPASGPSPRRGATPAAVGQRAGFLVVPRKSSSSSSWKCTVSSHRRHHDPQRAHRVPCTRRYRAGPVTFSTWLSQAKAWRS